MRPRVLFVVRNVPYVPATGGLTRIYHLVRAVAMVADVTLVGAADDPEDVRLDMAQALCERILLAPRPRPLPVTPHRPPRALRPFVRALHAGRALTRADPFPQGRINRAALRGMVRALMRENAYDAVVVDHTELTGMLADVVRAWGGPSIATLHDALSVLEQRKQEARRRGRRRPSLSGWRAIWQLRALERATLRAYTRVAAVSAIDAAAFRRLGGPNNIVVLPNGVDVDYFGAADAWPPDAVAAPSCAETLVFTGFLGYYTNVDALRFFVGDVWPLLRRRRPNARFWIVGGGPTAEVRDMARRDGIEVFASVPDVRPYLAASAVAVVPLRLGSGTRLKILEALAACRPVVSTTLGAEGLDLRPDHDLLLADTAPAFADAVVRLLERPADARRLAVQGRETVRRSYSWDSIGVEFQATLRAIID